MHCSNILFILQVKMADKGAALNLARKKKQEKKRKLNETRVANLAKKQKIKEQDNEITFRRIVDFNTLVWQLKDDCSKCNENPLLLTNVDFNEKRSSKRLAAVCGKCHPNGKLKGAYDTIFLLTGLRIYTGEYKAQGPTLCPTEGRALRGPRALYSPV